MLGKVLSTNEHYDTSATMLTVPLRNESGKVRRLISALL